MRPAELLAQKGMQPWLAPYAGWLLELLDYNGINYTVTSVLRTRAQQEALFKRFLEGKNAYPVAVPGTSKHELGLAMDVTMPDWAYEQLGAIWRKMGGRWSSSDRIHFDVAA